MRFLAKYGDILSGGIVAGSLINAGVDVMLQKPFGLDLVFAGISFGIYMLIVSTKWRNN